MKADNREQLLRLLPGLAEPVDFASVLEEAAKKSESLPQLVNLIWLAHSKKTKRERADGTLDSEKKKKLDQKAIDRKVYDDKLRNATHLTCYRCGVTKADYWAFSCGEERNETACRPCYVKERQERNQQVTHLQCCVETCQTTSSAVWMFCGGEEEDQPICQRCYGRLKVERMQKKTEYTCCECGVTTAKYWYMNGGESKDQTICLPCYDSNRPKRPLADAEHKCAACKVNGRYTTSGPPEYRDLCSGCYLRYRRSITGFYNEISCPAPCWGSSVKYCLTKKCRSHCAGKVKNKPRCYCQLEKTGAESEVDELDSEVDELDSE